MNVFIDTETVPCQHPQAQAEAAAGIKPPGALKKPESIAAWWETEAPAAAQAAWRKQSLDGGTQGEVVSIACTDGEGREWVHCRAPGDSERALLVQFIEAVEGWTADDAARAPAYSSAWPMDAHRLVGHHAAFDIGFLWRRCVVHGLRIPRWLPGPQARVGRDYSCTMVAWAGYGGRISLDSLCTALGLPSPKAGGMDGGMVLDAWLAGRREEIAAYNLQDARAVGAVWHRLAAVGAAV